MGTFLFIMRYYALGSHWNGVCALPVRCLFFRKELLPRYG